MKKFLYGILIFLINIYSINSYTETQQESEFQETKSVVIIGSGVGALTSAIYLQRAGIHAIVLEGTNPGGAIAQSPTVHNWPGEIAINGQTLVEKIRMQAEANGAKILSKEVIAVDFKKRPFSITVRDVYDHKKIETIYAKTCIIAIGSKPKLLGIPGESGETGYWTKGVYNCATCDGMLFRGKTVAVIGGGDSAILEAEYLSKIAKKVYVILRSNHFRTVEPLRKEELLKKDNVEILYNTKVQHIHGNGQKVTHVQLSTEKELQVDGIFIAIGATPNSEIFSGQVNMDSNGYILLTQGQETSVPGVFAIGDVIDPIYKQAISAAGDGAKAALQVERYLSIAPSISPKKDFSKEKPKDVVIQKTTSDSTTEIQEVTDVEQLYNAIGKTKTPLVVDFYSPYCGPCKQLNAELEKSKNIHGNIRFLKVDITALPELANTYNVFGVPTLMIFDSQGKMVKKASGFKEAQEALSKLDSHTLKNQ